MDNHPIPQDITGFQFKLIGDMTIKQFIYLAVGAVFAFFFFFILDIPTLVQWPLSLFCLGTGILVAFVPVDGRPMDTMLRNFFRALISPTQFVYQKGSVPEHKNPLPSTQQSIVHSIPISQTQPASAPLKEAKSAPTAVPVVFPEKEDEHKKENEELKKQLEELQKKLENQNKQQVASSLQPAPQPQEQNNQDLESMLTESQRQKEALEKQILEMQAKQEAAKKEKFIPLTAAPMQQTQNVRKIQADATSAAAQGMPEAPNLISGFIKDSRGNPIQNILIEVLDEDANPVRAFKTNSLGKFAAATSLSNGKYTISFEDPNEKHKFDAVEMELIGSPVMPIEVISIDSREELRRELFN